jgi:hypothetical protein
MVLTAGPMGRDLVSVLVAHANAYRGKVQPRERGIAPDARTEPPGPTHAESNGTRAFGDQSTLVDEGIEPLKR